MQFHLYYFYSVFKSFIFKYNFKFILMKFYFHFHRPPLIIAAQKGNTKIVQLLLSNKKIDVNYKAV